MNDSHRVLAAASGTLAGVLLEHLSTFASLAASVLTAGFMLACLIEKLRKNNWFPFGRWPF